MGRNTGQHVVGDIVGEHAGPFDRGGQDGVDGHPAGTQFFGEDLNDELRALLAAAVERVSGQGQRAHIPRRARVVTARCSARGPST